MLNIVFTDYMGNKTDLLFMSKEDWIIDAAVIANVFMQKGEWRIRLVFGWVKNPFMIICRYIKDVYPTKSKAETFANYFIKTTQKNSKLTETISIYDFSICYN